MASEPKAGLYRNAQSASYLPPTLANRFFGQRTDTLNTFYITMITNCKSILDRSFHVHCYKCEDCGLLLSSEAEGKGCYPLDDHVLCKACNTIRIQKLTQGIQ